MKEKIYLINLYNSNIEIFKIFTFAAWIGSNICNLGNDEFGDTGLGIHDNIFFTGIFKLIFSSSSLSSISLSSFSLSISPELYSSIFLEFMNQYIEKCNNFLNQISSDPTTFFKKFM
jgi:hypothetical protein